MAAAPTDNKLPATALPASAMVAASPAATDTSDSLAAAAALILSDAKRFRTDRFTTDAGTVASLRVRFGYDDRDDDGRSTLGQKLWHSAGVTCAFVERFRELFRGKTVLELGSGTGLCGLMCADTRVDAKRVVLSDSGEATLAVSRANGILNAPKSIDASESTKLTTAAATTATPSAAHTATLAVDPNRVQYRMLDWNSSADIAAGRATTADGAGFDVIVGSDVSYEFKIIPSLIRTCDAMLRTASPTAGAASNDVKTDTASKASLPVAAGTPFVLLVHECRPWLRELGDEELYGQLTTEQFLVQTATSPADATDSTAKRAARFKCTELDPSTFMVKPPQRDIKVFILTRN